MSEEKSPINIRSIESLLNEKFNIPRYQRGYRWEKTQIVELLDDIFDYGKKAYTDGNNAGNFYCLQPVVIKRNENKILWDVIDGQQRLTTIFIIIKYLQCVFPKTKFSFFTIDYETRNNDQNGDKGQGCDFLNNITFDPDKKLTTDNIDFYHMYMCSTYIEEWFTKHPGAEDIIKMILTSKEAPKKVSVIWYEVDSIADKFDSRNNDNQIDVFKRLNIGKIPLTDSELIKALLLQGDIYEKSEYIQRRLFEIAKEWDNIEYHLQKDEMWEFLNNKSYNPESRIDYLFRILSADWNSILDKDQQIENKDKQFEYHVFEKYISKRRGNENKIDTVMDIFNEINILFSVLDEWYNNRQMYHYIGFLVCQHKKEEESLKLIKDLFDYFLGKCHPNGERYKNGHTRKDCLDYVKLEINKFISLGSNQKLETLNYHSDYDKLLKILLFLNIESTIRLEKENTHFPFHLYKNEDPSIEHIYPQTPQEMNYEEIRTWLNSQGLTLLSINNNPNYSDDIKEKCIIISKRIDNLLKLKYDDVFKKEYNILSRCIEKTFDKLNKTSANQTDTLSNYALIGKDTNSKLNCNSFQRKREIIIKIIEREEPDGRGGIFNKYIPVCTRNIFQKHYTLQPDNIILWDREDRTAYFKAMEKIYNEFTNKITTGAKN